LATILDDGALHCHLDLIPVGFVNKLSDVLISNYHLVVNSNSFVFWVQTFDYHVIWSLSMGEVSQRHLSVNEIKIK
jgi:hypothetical protein